MLCFPTKGMVPPPIALFAAGATARYFVMITHSKLTLSSSSFIYTTGQQIVVKKKVEVGRLLIMLQSSKCCKIDQYLANIKEYPHDLGEYFIIKSVGKVILIQEQLSKN